MGTMVENRKFGLFTEYQLYSRGGISFRIKKVEEKKPEGVFIRLSDLSDKI